MKPIRTTLLTFIIFLLLSGVTAFPLRTEMSFLTKHKHSFPDFLNSWIDRVNDAISVTPDLVLYGTDWLAFAHIIIALFFIPVYLDPFKYRVNISVGIAACILVFPLAFICGTIRGIPFFHQLIDCSFGLIGGIFLYIINNKIKKLEHEKYS